MMQGYGWSRRSVLLGFGGLLISTAAIAAEQVKLAPASQPSAAATVVPAPRADAWWQQRHASMNERVKKGNADLLFIGDSITQGWEGAGKEVWAKAYAKRNAVNLGIGGDRTQHVLWRLEHGNIEGIKPKLAVIMIGTNNSGGDSVADIADGVRSIVKKLRVELPEMKILLLGIFPRGEQPNNQRGALTQINQIIARLDDGEHVFFLDIGPRLVNDDGSLSKQIMPDFLHLSPKGYQIWADAIEPQVAKLMGEK